MATESFSQDIIIRTPEEYARFMAILEETRDIPLPDFDLAAALKGGEEWLKWYKAHNNL